MNTHTKSQRINLRASERQEAVLRQAAQASDTSLSDFILGSAVETAERILADRRWFVATDEQFEEFTRLLDEPVATTKLAALFGRDSVFHKEFSMDDE